MWKALLVFVVILAGLLAVFVSAPPQPRAELTFINRGDVITLDPHRASWVQDFRVVNMLFQGLVTHDPLSTDMAVVAGAAESWTISDDRRTYTFRLRETGRWSDGTPVTAGDFVFAFRRALLPETACEFVTLFHLIDGAAAVTEWRTEALERFAAESHGSAEDRAKAAARLWEGTVNRFEATVGVSAPDPRTLVIRLARPTAYFLEALAMEAFVPLHASLAAMEGIDPATGRISTSSQWTRPAVLVCNGPYRLTHWRFKREMRFEKNPFYWDAADVSIVTVSIPTCENPNAAVLAVSTGAADWLTDVVPDYRADLIARKRDFLESHAGLVEPLLAAGHRGLEIERRLPPSEALNIHALPAFGTYFYNFNCSATLADGRPNPFAKAEVRIAFAMAINKARIVNELRRCGEPVAATLIPRGSLRGYRSPMGLPTDAAEARKILAEAGFPGGAGLPRIEILFSIDGANERIAQSVANDWRTLLGADVELVAKERKAFRRDLQAKNYMVSTASWFGDYADPTTFLDICRTGDANNDRGYHDCDYDFLLEKAARETDAEARLEILTGAEEMLLQRDAPLVPLFQYVSVYMFDPHRLSGVSTHPRLRQFVHRMSIVPAGAETAHSQPAHPSQPE